MDGWCPDEYRVGHEAHFGQVTEKFLEYLQDGAMPDWEVPNMITNTLLLSERWNLQKIKSR